MSLLFVLLALHATDTGVGWLPARLDLDLTLWPDREEIELDAMLRLRLDLDRSSGPTILLNAANANMKLERVLPPPGATVTIDQDGARAELRFAQPCTRGELVELRLIARSRRAQSFQFQVSEQITLASWTEAWYPHPAASDADSSRALRAPGTTTIAMPRGWRSIANGTLIDTFEDGERLTESWECEAAVARSFAAGPFHVAHAQLGDRTIGAFLLTASSESAERQALQLTRALEAMERRFGRYPYASYAIVEVPTARVAWGASSEQGFVMANSLSFAGGSGSLPLFAHEMAHGWWGNLVTGSGPGAILLSESLAQYGAVVAIEAIEGEAAATEFLRFSRSGYVLDQCARGYFEIVRRKQDVPLAQLLSGGVHHTLADAKGHWVYHMLRQRIGDELFFSTLRRIILEFRERPLTLAELRRSFIQAAPPAAQLELFFAQWLDRTGAPVLDVHWSKADADLVEVELAFADQPYDLTVELAVEDAGPQRLHRLALHDRTARVTLPATGAVRSVRLDPHHRLLVWQPEYGPRP
ncbi:MAG: M1 family aminopeptidase [Planctomycetota bacterium]